MFKESVIISQGPGPFSKGGPVRDFFARHSDGKIQSFLFKAKAGIVAAASLAVGKNPRPAMSWLYKRRASWLSEGDKHKDSGISYIKSAYFSPDASTSHYLSQMAFHEFNCLPEGTLNLSETAFVSHELNYEKEKAYLRNHNSRDASGFDIKNSQDRTFENIQSYSALVLGRLESARPELLGCEVSVIHMHASGHYRTYLEFIFRDTSPLFTLGEALDALKHVKSKERPFSVLNFYGAINKSRKATGGKLIDAARINSICADTDPVVEEYKILSTIHGMLERKSRVAGFPIRI